MKEHILNREWTRMNANMEQENYGREISKGNLRRPEVGLILYIFASIGVHSRSGKTRPGSNNVVFINASRLSEGAKRLTPQNLAAALNLAPNDRTRSFGYPDQARAKQTTGER